MGGGGGGGGGGKRSQKPAAVLTGFQAGVTHFGTAEIGSVGIFQHSENRARMLRTLTGVVESRKMSHRNVIPKGLIWTDLKHKQEYMLKQKATTTTTKHTTKKGGKTAD